ncbi:MAG: hypothetical protein JWM68_2844 [Verrucomicrobiales bacterium]|nr:hypothetical protein [Verrucomicrobiales bacterium]
MRRVLVLIFAVACLLNIRVEAASRIVKVLPHYLDLKGRHALSPSLYERDAYQAFLRDHAKERSAIRMNVQWKSDLEKSPNLKVRVELRGTKDKSINTKTLEQPASKNGWLTSWTPVEISGDQYREFGELVAWRVTLWDGETQLAEQKSFLW